ncbi:ABC transporter substrate-binding protein [Nocardiopsis sp. CNT-189]|uniref:ABC transporter substrate-binding protein n=1 Tax=Nocardiopsis oceanisediminis TaxID=2816862 RepID=UPI003B33F2E9
MPDAPERVVSLLASYTDTAAALDADVVGIADFSGDGTLFPWLEGEIDLEGGTVTDLGNAYEPIGIESIAALEPDLILASQYQVPDEEAYERLSGIAPTYVSLGPTSDSDPWQDTTRAIGTLLGAEEKAEQAIADTEEAIAGTAERRPAADGATAVYAGVTADGYRPVTDPEGPTMALLGGLGFTLPERLEGEENMAVVSPELLEDLDADAVFYVSQDGTAVEELPGWDDLSAVERGTAQELDLAASNALISPSVLNVPYVLEAIDPTLEALEASS